MQVEIAELRAYLRRLQQVADALGECTAEELEDNTVRWIEISGRDENRVRVARCPLAVGKPLAEWVYDKMESVVMTSATLAVRRQFAYCKTRVGLDLVPEARMTEVLLDSPFDFRNQALMCVPTDGPPPNAPDYLERLVPDIRTILNITRGLLLSSSLPSAPWTMHDILEPELRAKASRPSARARTPGPGCWVCSRRPVQRALPRTSSGRAWMSLASSAMRGADAAALPCSHSPSWRHAPGIERAGGNAFMDLSVPQAVIKLRQGFGRLIRRKTDWGSVVILDNRIVTKYYGKAFLGSLPEVPVVSGPAAKVWAELDRFYKKKRGE